MTTTMIRASEYEGRFWIVNATEQWQAHPNENIKLLMAPSPTNEEHKPH